ncbi:MAG: ATP-dependent DNA ligase [Firmicutes bacterium HGW-Firmicutes-1]|jgi:bifunctional non-homologous end joining protein LigD|nr:MAG: ATP-dependent DNA ligase [Firmicutes bacterium HGW-Firmicutes-1]
MEIIKPMEPILSKIIPQCDEWIHQIKWDGIRGLSYINNNSIVVLTKKGNERTAFYPELQEVIQLLQGKEAILDGEMVVFDNQGRPSFANILMRERIRTFERLNQYLVKYPVKYIVFDILYLDGKDLRKKSLIQRKKILNDKMSKSPNISITDDFDDGHALYKLMKDQNLEGIVSKKKNSVYIEGKSHNEWLKIKALKKILVIVGGIQLKNDYPSSLMIGVYRDAQLEYIGNVSSGLKSSDYQLLQSYKEELGSTVSPFVNYQKSDKGHFWIRATITCWVQFMEWTSTGGLRHPTLIGFSSLDVLEANGKEYILD